MGQEHASSSRPLNGKANRTWGGGGRRKFPFANGCVFPSGSSSSSTWRLDFHVDFAPLQACECFIANDLC
ncbi:GD13853 [Drosophila simulans]|uniref:GD13853 n=1 Tax=Drosophila simulans TaxID=7240 RepID=B4QR06_DROSI|nr:GD13853 [Drosophila simulans]